jgi:hypothetical protein
MWLDHITGSWYFDEEINKRGTDQGEGMDITITNSSKRLEPPVCVHQDDIVDGCVDWTAARRREEAELKRLIAISQKPSAPAPKCDHGWPVKTHTFSDGRVLKLFGCGCSNGTEIL